MSGAPGEGRPYVVRREAWDALVARAEAAEARVEELLVKWSEAKYVTEAAEAERGKAKLLTEAEKEISAGAIQAMRAAEADLREALDAAMEAAKQDTANLAKVTALEAALRRLLTVLDQEVAAQGGVPDSVDARTEAVSVLAALDRQEP